MADPANTSIRDWMKEHLREIAGPRDWPEDYEDENGTYSHVCFVCAQPFTGHKIRYVCKECETKRIADAPSENSVTMRICPDPCGLEDQAARNGGVACAHAKAHDPNSECGYVTAYCPECVTLESKKAYSDNWPKEIRKVQDQDPMLCIGDECTFRNESLPHSAIFAQTVRDIVKHYGGAAGVLPPCIPMNTKRVNDLLCRARVVMGLTENVPHPVCDSDPIYSDHINMVLYECLIEPMERRRLAGDDGTIPEDDTAGENDTITEEDSLGLGVDANDESHCPDCETDFTGEECPNCPGGN